MRVAVAQIEPRLGEVGRNLEVCLARIDQAASDGAELLVLPECAIPGYMFDSAEEALPFAEAIPGPATEVLERECRRLGMHVVCGMLERDGDALRNAAVLIGPSGLIGTYRKTYGGAVQDRREIVGRHAGDAADDADPIEHADRLVVRSARHLRQPQLTRFGVVQQEVGERSADVDPEP